jgi:hypothetical protein
MSATEPWRITALDESRTACRPKTWSPHGRAMVAVIFILSTDSFSSEHTSRFIGRSSILFSPSHLSLYPLLASWLALELRARRLVDCSAGRSFSDC